MSDDFTKQLQENAVDKAIYESKKQETEKNERENARLSLYRNVIERTKDACVEAVKTGAFSTDGNRRKVCGTLDFFCDRDTDDYYYCYEKSLCVNIEIQGAIMAHFYPLKDRWLCRHIFDELIVFIIHERQEVDVATVYKGNIIKNLIMDCQSYTKYRPNETTGGIFVSWRRKEELPTGA